MNQKHLTRLKQFYEHTQTAEGIKQKKAVNQHAQGIQ